MTWRSSRRRLRPRGRSSGSPTASPHARSPNRAATCRHQALDDARPVRRGLPRPLQVQPQQADRDAEPLGLREAPLRDVRRHGRLGPHQTPLLRDAPPEWCVTQRWLGNGPGADGWVGGEAGLGLGACVAPADVGGDRGVLLGVAAVVGAIEGEVEQRGELGPDPVQPGSIGRQEHQLDPVGRRPTCGCPGGGAGRSCP